MPCIYHFLIKRKKIFKQPNIRTTYGHRMTSGIENDCLEWEDLTMEGSHCIQTMEILFLEKFDTKR